MNIGFDFDKVFIDYPPFIPDYFFDRFYKKKTKKTLLYRLPSKPEQLFRRLTHLSFLRPVITENLLFLKKLAKKHHHLYLVSSRFSFLKQATTQIVKRHHFDTLFDGLYFNFKDEQPHLFKTRMIKKLKLDMYIDDDLALLQYVAKKNTTIKLYWLNKHVIGKVDDRITGVTSLDTIPMKKSR